MSKIKSAPRKKDWQKAPPHAQYWSFMWGPGWAEAVKEHELATICYLFSQRLTKLSLNKCLSAFRKPDPQSLEEDFKYLAVELVFFVTDCINSADAAPLFKLAAAIEQGARQKHPPVDPHRAWLFKAFEPEIRAPKRPARVPKTFAEIRDAFFAEFAETSMDDSQLRKMIAEFGVILLPAKRGPKGPRNSGE